MGRLAFALLLGLLCLGAQAEPYLAVQSGWRCAQCHVNQTGGGLRTALGHRFAQTQLASRSLESLERWTGRVGDHLALGANLRASATRSDSSGMRRSEQLDLREARLYLAVSPLPERLVFYADQFLAPGAASNREAFVLYRAADASHYLKAGRFYLPFGWRLQDSATLVRQQTAIDMNAPDRGVEAGWDHGPMSLQFAISNGTFGGPEVDRGKQYSLQAAWLGDGWRLGAAGNFNDQTVGDRTAVGLFGGVRHGPVQWLAEVAVVRDERRARSLGTLLEANWRITQGHQLKLSAETLRASAAQDRQQRMGAVYEATPLPLLQLRAGLHHQRRSPSLSDGSSQVRSFVELHTFF